MHLSYNYHKHMHASESGMCGEVFSLGSNQARDFVAEYFLTTM